MLVGYMRDSSDSDRQSTDLQRDALLVAGVDPRHLFEDRASGATDDRTGLAQALEFVRPGDVLVVWKTDRLGRSLSHLLAIVNSLKDKQVAFHSVTEGMDITTASASSCFTCSARLRSTSAP
jgi:DNA invertase Pin-like site-specific DNA recombinase